MTRFLALVALIFFCGCSVKELNLAEVLRYEQNTSILPPTPLVTADDLSQYQERYMQKQFAPWEEKRLRNSLNEAAWGLSFLNGARKFTSENLLGVSNETLQGIKEQTNFEAHGTVMEYAVTVEESHLRVLPTDKPFFRKQSNGSSDYPFDYIQNSLLGIMQPLLISHYSKDAAWAFVESSFAAGWVKTNEIALIDEELAEKIKNSPHIVITKDNAPLYLENSLFAHYIKMGAILPLLKSDEENYRVFITYSDTYKRAKAVNATINKKFAAPFPLEFNEENVKAALNELLGENYGWGGLYNNRDCSAMTKDFFSLFGVWLPRNSLSQKRSSAFVDMQNLTLAKKEQTLKELGVPYMTLVYMPGHIMLYVGQMDERALIMHNIWGVTNNKGGKFLIGKSIISDLHIGENLPDMKKKNLLMSKIQGFTVFAPRSTIIEIKLLKTYQDTIEKIANNTVYLKDGSEIVFSDKKQKNYEQIFKNPDILDQFYEVYTKGAINNTNKNDAGKIRNEEFFKAMYGHNKQEVEQNLIEVSWLPSTVNKTVLFNQKNGAAKALQAVSNELDKLDEKYLEFLDNIDGTYSYQQIARNGKLNIHTLGIAIDINPSQSRYWLQNETKNDDEGQIIPQTIIDIFEKHGFIWGGKWRHYDAMHFEYRPELF
ncbi:MAG: SH3 domain-containing protein [Campylobacteraceae bacterium]|jgi:cell wall-associated NlpC family hydrolase|nr:SH3 domain-containing protein [Campylobacteraceae bacterium]